MTSDTGDQGSGPRKPAQSGRRAPTIELKATEVASEPVADSRPAADDPVHEPAPVLAGNDARQSETQAKTGGVPPRGRDPVSRRPFWDQMPGGLSLPLIGTAVAAGIVFFLLGLATANLFVGREVAADARLERTQTADDLAERLAKIEAALAAPRAPDTALIGRIAAAEAAAKLATENAAAQQRRAEELAGLVRDARSRADAAVASTETLKGTAASTPDGPRIDVDALNQRIVALEQALKANETELARRTAGAIDERKNRVAVVASVLLSAVERGAPFAAELAAAKTLAPDSAHLAPLETFAANGVPGAVVLARDLAAIVPALLKAAGSETRQDAGLLEKLQANAERLVRVRPVGEAQGDRPVDVVARIEAKASAADIAGALTELSRLPPQMRVPAEAWIAKANARQTALASARQFSIGALAAIGKPNT